MLENEINQYHINYNHGILLLFILFYGSIFANNSTSISSTIDLTNIIEDKVPVTINLNNIEARSLVYRFPKVIQGTYAISDFGRFVENLQAFDIKGNKLPILRVDINSWKIKHAKRLSKITYLINDTYDLDKKTYNNITQFPAGTNIDPENYVLNLHGFIGYFEELNDKKHTLNIKAPSHFSYTTGLELENYKTNNDNTKHYTFTAPRYFDLITIPYYLED
ncbi:M61 family metallopeptidase [Thalassobellus citreus]|uniref:M61 family metallopeptidase n=1 Tax=Thalassobellus citreus TaxID=3367752 RepID=UPI0037BE03DB